MRPLSLAIAAVLALVAAGPATAQSLQYLCDPASPQFNKRQCERQLNYKTEMLKCLTGAQAVVMKKHGLHRAEDIPPRDEKMVARWCERTVREVLRRK